MIKFFKSLVWIKGESRVNRRKEQVSRILANSFALRLPFLVILHIDSLSPDHIKFTAAGTLRLLSPINSGKLIFEDERSATIVKYSLNIKSWLVFSFILFPILSILLCYFGVLSGVSGCTLAILITAVLPFLSIYSHRKTIESRINTYLENLVYYQN